MDDHRSSPQGETRLAGRHDSGRKSVDFPREIAVLVGRSPDTPAESVWEAFLAAFSDLLLKTAVYAHRRHARSLETPDASRDAYAYVIERLRQDDFRRLRAFSGGDEAALSRWLVVVARRLCTDFWRHRYGRVRPSTPEMDRDTRRRLADEVWDPREPSEFPAPKGSNPEWKLRHGERREALESAMGELEPEEQLLLAYRFEDGLSARQIADLMKVPTPFHVYRRVNRVLKTLRKRLEGMGIDGADP